MNLPLGIVINGIDAFILIFVRMTGLFVVAPIFGRRNIPTIMKIGFSFLLALLLVNTVKTTGLNQYESIYEFVFLVIKEFIVGITIGYVSNLVLNAIYLAGQLIDMQIGFGIVNVLDPMSNIQVPITANFYFMISMLVFIAVNGHYVLIKALFDSYNTVPLGGAVFGTGLMEDIIRVFGSIFTIGFKIAAPITAAILIADITLGVISRTVPQLNVFVVGMPLKILLGLLVLVLTIPMFIMVLENLFDVMNGETVKFIKDMVPG